MGKDIKKLFEYWLTEAAYSLEVADSLRESKKNVECLFFGHLALEKMFKALVVAATNSPSPTIHNLSKLALLSGLTITQDVNRLLVNFNNFYLAGRYDEEKMSFRKLCTEKFTETNFTEIKNIYLWLRKESEKASRL